MRVVAGNISGMVADVREGLAWVHRNCGMYGGDTTKVCSQAIPPKLLLRERLRRETMSLVFMSVICCCYAWLSWLKCVAMVVVAPSAPAPAVAAALGEGACEGVSEGGDLHSLRVW